MRGLQNLKDKVGKSSMEMKIVRFKLWVLAVCLLINSPIFVDREEINFWHSLSLLYKLWLLMYRLLIASWTLLASQRITQLLGVENPFCTVFQHWITIRLSWMDNLLFLNRNIKKKGCKINSSLILLLLLVSKKRKNFYRDINEHNSMLTWYITRIGWML